MLSEIASRTSSFAVEAQIILFIIVEFEFVALLVSDGVEIPSPSVTS